MHADLDQPALDRASEDRESDHRGEHLREERDDVAVQESHGASFDRRRRRIPGATAPCTFARGVRDLERGRLDGEAVAFDEALSEATAPAEVAAIRNKRD